MGVQLAPHLPGSEDAFQTTKGGPAGGEDGFWATLPRDFGRRGARLLRREQAVWRGAGPTREDGFFCGDECDTSEADSRGKSTMHKRLILYPTFCLTRMQRLWNIGRAIGVRGFDDSHDHEQDEMKRAVASAKCEYERDKVNEPGGA